MTWTEADVGKTPESDVIARAMGWHRPVLRSDEGKAKTLASIDQGLHDARGLPKPRGRKKR